jgi:formiminotetrahydrofolate cyclodeaminase
MISIHKNTLADFIYELASKNPIPGGGGASALIGVVGVSLCSMVANLTSGNKKYVEYQSDIDAVLPNISTSIPVLLELVEKDAEVFEPLSMAYRLPKEEPNRDEILENALVSACAVPMKIIKEISKVVDIIERLSIKGSKLAISDIGVAASACRCALEGAIMNIYINTKLMKRQDFAKQVNAEAEAMLNDAVYRCNDVYKKITNEIRSVKCGN